MRLGAAKLAWPERDLVSQAERAMGVDHRHSDVDRQCEHFVAPHLNTSHEGRLSPKALSVYRSGLKEVDRSNR